MEDIRVMFIVLMLAYVAFTIFFGLRRARALDCGSVGDWFCAQKRITWVGVGLSMSAAWLDMATVFLNTGGAYSVGISAIWFLAGPELICFLLLGLIFARRIRQIPLLSQPEMLEKRYSPALRPLYSFIWVISLAGYAALSFFVFQMTFNYFFGLAPFTSAIIVLGIVLGYQLLGGFLAVIFADYVQAILVFVATLALVIFSVNAAGGISTITSSVPANFLHPFGIGTGTVGVIMLSLLPAFLVEPTAWQRIVSAKTDREASKGMLFAFAIFFPICIFTLLAGLASHILFPTWELSTDLIAYQMAISFFNPVVSAVVITGIVAALISSFSSFTNAANLSLSYDLIPDLYRRIKKQPFPEDKYRPLSRVGLVIIGIMAAFFAVQFSSLLEIVLFAGTIAGAGIFWPVMSMLYWKRANTQGAVASFVLGSGVAIVWYALGSPMGIAPILIGFPLSFAAMLVGTLAFPPPKKEQLALFFSEEEA